MPGGWAGSDRRDRLPPDWAQRRAAVKERAGGRCEQIKGSNGKRCPNPGTDCDHIERGDNHELSNLQLLCFFHHRAKSSAEGNAAAAAVRAKTKRPVPQHPGLR